MTKMSKKEKAAKAKAYASRFTEPMALDIWALGGYGIHHGLRYSKTKDGDVAKLELGRGYLGYNIDTKQLELEELVKGFGGTINRQIEKKGFKMLGIKGPRSNLDTPGDILDHITYYLSTYIAQDEAPEGDLYYKHRNAYHAMNGIDFWKQGLDAWQPKKMFEQKIIPYTAQKMIRKVPIVKRTLAKLAKMM